MAYTRRHGVARSLIKVIDVAHIPYQKDIYFEDESYRLTFEIEDNDSLSDGDDMVVDGQNKEKDKEDEEKKEDKSKDDNSRKTSKSTKGMSNGGSGMLLPHVSTNLKSK
jgi:hypothetical protein